MGWPGASRHRQIVCAKKGLGRSQAHQSVCFSLSVYLTASPFGIAMGALAGGGAAAAPTGAVAQHWVIPPQELPQPLPQLLQQRLWWKRVE
jgi:hypothetical protein